MLKLTPDELRAVIASTPCLYNNERMVADYAAQHTAEDFYRHIRHYCTEAGYKGIGEWLASQGVEIKADERG